MTAEIGKFLRGIVEYTVQDTNERYSEVSIRGLEVPSKGSSEDVVPEKAVTEQNERCYLEYIFDQTELSTVAATLALVDVS